MIRFVSASIYIMRLALLPACKNIGVVLIIPGLLLAGSLLYINSGVFFMQWLSRAGAGGLIASVQAQAGGFVQQLPSSLRYSLADGLWMMAFILTVLLIWNFRLSRTSLAWCGIALGLGLAFEGLQFFHLIPGYFDPADMAWISAGGISPLIILFLCKKLSRI